MVSILSVNAAQQPSRIPGSIGNRNHRARELAERILDEDVDIICFQELFRTQSQNIIKDILKNDYPYFHIDTSWGKYLIGVNSGLAMFSKYPIRGKPTIHPYTVFKGVENFARKGLQHVSVKVDDTIFEVFNTHLQTGIGSEPCICKIFDRKAVADHTSSQLKQEQTTQIMSILKNYIDRPLILVGDFNIRADSTLYPIVAGEFEESLGLIDVFDEDNSFNDSSVVGKPDRRIDYVWTNMDQSSYIILDEWSATDHHAIIGSIDKN